MSSQKLCLNFGQAIEALKNGKRAARLGWNGKNMFIYLNKGSVDHRSLKDSTTGEFLENAGHVEGVKLSLNLFEQGAEGTSLRLPNINMQSSNGNTVTGWLASQTDMLAEDWLILD